MSAPPAPPAPPGGGAGMPAEAFAPRPAAAPVARMIAAQTAMELRLLVRNGEQLLLTIVIPAILLVVFASAPVLDLGPGARVDFLTPGVLALAVMSTAFTGQAIATGFERRYGVLKRLGTTPLPRWALLAAKTLAVLTIEVVQIGLLMAVATALGWSTHAPVLSAVLAVIVLVAAGTAAFSGLGLLMAGTLRAEATLAAANVVYVLFLVAGGVVVPLTRFADGLRHVLELLPLGALSDGLRSVLREGAGIPWSAAAILLVWAVLASAAAAATFRWE
jgi:ABC-2 type transport system permease protein